MSATTDSHDIRHIGQVKWFNNKTGYGFITAIDGDLLGKDIFTHFSAIHVSDSQYKYLMQGEYVEFGVIKLQQGNHEYQSTNITGIKGGTLMCEARNMAFSQDRKSKTPAENRPASPITAPPGV